MEAVMNNYLIVYSDDRFFVTEAVSFADAVFSLAKYTGNDLNPTYKKALLAMETPSEVVELYNRLANSDEIQTVYLIGSVLYTSSDKKG